MIAFRLHPSAERELESAAAWYERRRVGLGVAFLLQYRATLERAQRMPHSGALIADVATRSFTLRRFLCERFPYALVVGVTDQELLVLAVPHQRRKPDYWVGRLPKTLR